MPRRPSLAVVKKMGYSGANVIRFLSIRISTVDRLTVSNGLLEVDIYKSFWNQRTLLWRRRIKLGHEGKCSLDFYS